MTTAISKKISSAPLFIQPEIGSLQGRTITKQAAGNSLKSTWEKICRWVMELLYWMKSFFIAAPLKKEVESALDLITPSSIDTSFLRPNDPSYNLARLGELTAENAIQSISTEEVVKALPRTNPIRLGYDDPVDYQTALGDRAVATQTFVTGAAIFSLSRWLRSSCLQGHNVAEMGRGYAICSREAADFWQGTPGKTLLGGSALLLAASLYAHSKGWIGQLLHDRSSGWRQSRIETLFQAAAKELGELSKKDAAAAEDLARKILKNSDLIEATLHVDLQIPRLKAASLTNLLKNACQQLLDPDPTFGKTP